VNSLTEIPAYYLDKEDSVLCTVCAKESENDYIPQFRPVSGPHVNSSKINCDECSDEIPSFDSEDEEL
jgi:hypothetical protein